MSKFIDNVKWHLTGKQYQKVPHFKPIEWLSADISEIEYLHEDRLKEFKASVVWCLKYKCKDKGPERELMFENALHQLRRDIFGEFINDILALERALYGGEENKAYEILEKIKKEVMG